MLSVVLAEGITDADFLAGLLGIDDLEQARSRAARVISMYRCYQKGDTIICEGGGKDNICRRGKEISDILKSRGTEFRVRILLDGDARDIKCDVGETFHLSNKNLDELIFLITAGLLSKEEYAKDLIENELNSPDSKLKAYLAMYLFKKYLAPDKKWTSLGSFYHYVSMKYKDLVLQSDEGLNRMVSHCILNH